MLRSKKILIVLMLVLASGSLLAQGKKTALILKGSWWPSDNGLVHVSTRDSESEVTVGQGGGWLTMLSRISETSFLEFSLGAVGEVESESRWFEEDEVAVQGMTPVTLGLRYHFFPIENNLAIQPYVGCGGGPYWLSDVKVWDDRYDSTVKVDSKLVPGFYISGGFDFMMTSWLGWNMDLRYHLVNLDVDHANSGTEMAFGLLFRWGRFE